WGNARDRRLPPGSAWSDRARSAHHSRYKWRRSARITGAVTPGPDWQGKNMRTTKNLGKLLLGIWLILMGLIPLLHLLIPYVTTLMALLAVAAGVFILLDR